MGDVVQQDIVLTLDVVHKLIKGLEQDFLSEQEQAAKKYFRYNGVYLGAIIGRSDKWGNFEVSSRGDLTVFCGILH